MRNRNLAVLLFGLLTFGALLISAASKPQAGAAISGEAKSPSNLGGQMPPSFNQDVARVVAEVDRIEADTLSQMERTTLDRQGQVRTWGSYCSSISTSRLNRTRPAVSAIRRRRDSPGRFNL